MTKPSEETKRPWLEEKYEAYDHYPNNGKWMLFYRRGDEMNAMDTAWAKATDLYRRGEFSIDDHTGVSHMRCSTAAPNPKTKDPETSVIMMSCGPADDKGACMLVGKLIMAKMGYRTRMYYKETYDQAAPDRRLKAYQVDPFFSDAGISPDVYRLTFGKHKGKTIEEVAMTDKRYLEWLNGQSFFSDRRGELTPYL